MPLLPPKNKEIDYFFGKKKIKGEDIYTKNQKSNYFWKKKIKKFKD